MITGTLVAAELRLLLVLRGKRRSWAILNRSYAAYPSGDTFWWLRHL